MNYPILPQNYQFGGMLEALRAMGNLSGNLNIPTKLDDDFFNSSINSAESIFSTLKNEDSTGLERLNSLSDFKDLFGNALALNDTVAQERKAAALDPLRNLSAYTVDPSRGGFSFQDGGETGPGFDFNNDGLIDGGNTQNGFLTPDTNINAILKIESSFDPTAISPTGAVGLGQQTSIALKDFNQETGGNFTKEDMFDPKNSARVAAWQFNKRIPQMLENKQLPNSLSNRAMSYNGGVGKLDSLYKKYKVSPDNPGELIKKLTKSKVAKEVEIGNYATKFWRARNEFSTPENNQFGGLINGTGYLDGAPTSQNPLNIIPSNKITMDGVSTPLIVQPFQNGGQLGEPMKLKPNSGEYEFDGADGVIEQPDTEALINADIKARVKAMKKEQKNKLFETLPAAGQEIELNSTMPITYGKGGKVQKIRPKYQEGGYPSIPNIIALSTGSGLFNQPFNSPFGGLGGVQSAQLGGMFAGSGLFPNIENRFPNRQSFGNTLATVDRTDPNSLPVAHNYGTPRVNSGNNSPMGDYLGGYGLTPQSQQVYATGGGIYPEQMFLGGVSKFFGNVAKGVGKGIGAVAKGVKDIGLYGIDNMTNLALGADIIKDGAYSYGISKDISGFSGNLLNKVGDVAVPIAASAFLGPEAAAAVSGIRGTTNALNDGKGIMGALGAGALGAGASYLGAKGLGNTGGFGNIQGNAGNLFSGNFFNDARKLGQVAKDFQGRQAKASPFINAITGGGQQQNPYQFNPANFGYQGQQYASPGINPMAGQMFNPAQYFQQLSGIMGNNNPFSALLNGQNGGYIPQRFQMGGSVLEQNGFQGIQAEIYKGKPEMIALPDMSLVYTNAKESHKEMDKDVVTDYVPEGSYVFSSHDRMEMDLDTAEDIPIGVKAMPYKERMKGSLPKEINFDSIFPNKVKSAVPSEISKWISDKYKVLDDYSDDIFIDSANMENKAGRMPYIEKLIEYNEWKKPVKTPKFKMGGQVPTAQFGLEGAYNSQFGVDPLSNSFPWEQPVSLPSDLTSQIINSGGTQANPTFMQGLGNVAGNFLGNLFNPSRPDVNNGAIKGISPLERTLLAGAAAGNIAGNIQQRGAVNDAYNQIGEYGQQALGNTQNALGMNLAAGLAGNFLQDPTVQFNPLQDQFLRNNERLARRAYGQPAIDAQISAIQGMNRPLLDAAQDSGGRFGNIAAMMNNIQGGGYNAINSAIMGNNQNLYSALSGINNQRQDIFNNNILGRTDALNQTVSNQNQLTNNTFNKIGSYGLSNADAQNQYLNLQGQLGLSQAQLPNALQMASSGMLGFIPTNYALSQGIV